LVSKPISTTKPNCPRPRLRRTSDQSVARYGYGRKLVAAWMQDRAGSNGDGAPGLGFALSRDGGKRWRAARIPGLTRCDGGSADRTAVNEAQVSVGADGTIYVGLEIYVGETSGAAGRERLAAIVRSTDGGHRWNRPWILGPTDKFADQEFVTPDPSRPSHAYASWHNFEPDPTGQLPKDAATYLAETSDAGKHWSAPRLVSRPAPGNYNVASHLLLEPDGTLVNVFTRLTAANLIGPPAPGATQVSIASMRSEDGGMTWSPPLQVATLNAPAVVDPDTGQAVNLFANETVATGPHGTIYVAWRDIQDIGASRILVSRSRDGGKSWVTLPAAAEVPAQAFLPQVAVARDGRVGVSWDDLRKDHPGDDELTANVWFASSGDHGRSWGRLRLTPSFDLRETYAGDESLVGDTAGLTAGRAGFTATANVGPGRGRPGLTSLFSIRVRPSVHARHRTFR
jgi:hypothetical protein